MSFKVKLSGIHKPHLPLNLKLKKVFRCSGGRETNFFLFFFFLTSFPLAHFHLFVSKFCANHLSFLLLLAKSRREGHLGEGMKENKSRFESLSGKNFPHLENALLVSILEAGGVAFLKTA
jgi:hypothetical protein